MAGTHEDYRQSMRAVRGLIGREGADGAISDEELFENRTHILAIATRFEAVRRGIIGTRALAAVISMSKDIVRLLERLDGARAEALAHTLLSEPTALVELRDGTVVPSGGLDNKSEAAAAAA